MVNVAKGDNATPISFLFIIRWEDLVLTGFFFRNPTTDMSSNTNTDVKIAVPIFDGSNYNVWVDQMKFWLQSQNLWRVVNGTIPRPTVGLGPPPVTAQDVAAWDDKDEAAFGAISLRIAHHMRAAVLTEIGRAHV